MRKKRRKEGSERSEARSEGSRERSTFNLRRIMWKTGRESRTRKRPLSTWRYNAAGASDKSVLKILALKAPRGDCFPFPLPSFFFFFFIFEWNPRPSKPLRYTVASPTLIASLIAVSFGARNFYISSLYFPLLFWSMRSLVVMPLYAVQF